MKRVTVLSFIICPMTTHTNVGHANGLISATHLLHESESTLKTTYVHTREITTPSSTGDSHQERHLITINSERESRSLWTDYSCQRDKETAYR